MRKTTSLKVDKSQNQLAEKVEKIGIMIEQMGQPPIPGRIIAYLMLSEPPYRDFYGIQEFLKASKSSVSTALNQLMQAGVVNYITFSGDRKRYFQIDTKGLVNVMKQQYKQGQLLNDMIQASPRPIGEGRYLRIFGINVSSKVNTVPIVKPAKIPTLAVGCSPSIPTDRASATVL